MKKFSRLGRGIALALLCALPLQGTNITGTLLAPNGTAVANGTLSLALSQAGVVAGSFSISSTPVSCYTSDNGAVVGIPNPLIAPVVTPDTAAGSITAGTWYLRITYYGTAVESLPSPPTTAVLGATGEFVVTQPTLQPSSATGYKVYLGTTAATVKLQATTVFGSNTTVTSYSAGGADDPTTNNSVCSIQGNDTIIPTFTSYLVTATNRNGAAVPGFPQSWYLSGATVNISNSLPLAAVGQQMRFPTPLLANPSSNAQQSVASPVTLNGYPLAAGSILLANNSDPPTCAAGGVTIYSSGAGALTICEGVTAITVSGNTYKTANMSGGDATVTAEQDLSGASVSLDRNGNWLLIGTFDVGLTGSAVGLATGYINYDGSNQTPVAVISTDADSDIRTTMTQTVVVTVSSQPDVAKLRAIRTSGTATTTVYQTNTNIRAVWIGN